MTVPGMIPRKSLGTAYIKSGAYKKAAGASRAISWSNVAYPATRSASGAVENIFSSILSVFGFAYMLML